MNGFNWLDYLLLGVLAVAVIGSVKNGFVREAVSLGALIAGLLCALWFYGAAAFYLKPYVSHPGIANFLGFMLVLAIFAMLGGLVQWVLAKLLKLTGLTWVDRLAGGVFGLLKGALAAVILILAISAFAPGRPPKVVAQSRVSPYLMGAAEVLSAIAPLEVKEGFRESYEKVREIWARAVEKSPVPIPSHEL